MQQDAVPPTSVILVLAGVLFVGALVGRAIERYLSQQRRKAWRERNPPGWNKRQLGTVINPGVWNSGQSADANRPTDAADQLRIVMGATFTKQPLLNKSEIRLFKEVDRVVIGCNPEWQVMAQVSLGEILRSKDSIAFGCINSKRVDLLLVDGECQPRHAIEYQGDGHHQSKAAARDAVKKEALRRAGIGYHEVIAGQTKPAELRLLVEKLVDKPVMETATQESGDFGNRNSEDR
jgi:hypothetical protein